MTMIEKIARALCERKVRSGLAADWTASLRTTPIEDTVARYVDRDWRKCSGDARAALEAMLEPSEGMLDASWRQTGKSKEMRQRTHIHYKRHYQAMIRHALENEK